MCNEKARVGRLGPFIKEMAAAEPLRTEKAIKQK